MEIKTLYNDREVQLLGEYADEYVLLVIRTDTRESTAATITREEMERVAREILGIKEPEQTLADKIRALPVGTKFVFTDEPDAVNVKVTVDKFYSPSNGLIIRADTQDDTPSSAGYDIEVVE